MARGPGKGNTNNPNGRPKGTPNKTTKEMREVFAVIMSGQIDRIREALDNLYEADPIKYLDILNKYMPYYMPKKLDVTSDDKPISKIQVTVSNKGDKGEIDKLDKND